MKLSPTIFVFNLLILIFTCSCTDHEELYNDSSSASLLRVAESMRKSKDYSTAMQLYNQVLETIPSHSDAKLGLALCYMENGKINEAIQLLEESLENHPNHVKILKTLGKAYIQANKGDKAEPLYQKLYSIQPEDIFVLNGLGICSDLKAQHTEAQTWYQKALEKDKNNINIQSNYGLSLALGGDLKKSIVYLLKLSQHSKATQNVRHNLAVAYALAGDSVKAREYFKEGLDEGSARKNIHFLSTVTPPKLNPPSIQSYKLEALEDGTPPKIQHTPLKKKKLLPAPKRKKGLQAKKQTPQKDSLPAESLKPLPLPSENEKPPVTFPRDRSSEEST